MKTWNSIKDKLIYMLLLVGVFVSLFPFYWMFMGATNPSGEVFSIQPKIIPGNYFMTNFLGLNEEIGILRIFSNSLFLAVTYTVCTVFLSALAGYTFAKFKFRGQRLLFGIILAYIMIPQQVKLVPLFIMMTKIGWNNSYQAVLLPNMVNAFGIFFMRQNIVSLPDSLIEAARIEGCKEFSIFTKIVLPTMKPALSAIGIYMFMYQWNNFMWPLIILNTTEMYTLPVALSSLIGLSTIDYGQVLCGATLATVPIMVVFLSLQKQFISGVMGGAVKG